MYNTNISDKNELPSTRQLLISTFIALIVAILLLITVILPAEYGIDPTGVGRTLGLAQMEKIKIQLADEAAQEKPKVAEESAAEVAIGLNVVKTESIAEPSSDLESTALNTEQLKIELKPGQAAEVKVALKKGEQVHYQWSVNAGHVNFDTHGDNALIKYFNYNKGKSVTLDQGDLIAEFDGKHGWFWRNRSEKTVLVALQVEGNFAELLRVL